MSDVLSASGSLTLETLTAFLGHLKEDCSASSYYPIYEMSPRMYKRLPYLAYLGKAHLSDPPYKIRKCHMRSIAKRRQAARRRYL